MISLNVAEVEDLFVLSCLLICSFITIGIISWDTAVSRMEGTILFQIAASFVLGKALQNTGVAQIIGDLLIDVFKEGGSIGVLYGCYVTTAILTAILTNSAAASVVLPITKSFVASGLVSEKAVIIVVMLAASCDFLTSIGYQTNIMICAPGNYKFTDFTKFGAALTLLVSVIGTGAAYFFFNSTSA